MISIELGRTRGFAGALLLGAALLAVSGSAAEERGAQAAAAEERGAQAAAAEERGAQAAAAAVRLDRAALAGLGLEAYEPYPAEVVLEGRSRHKSQVVFRGDEIVAEVWEAEAAKLALSEPFPYDEFVWVLSGKLILTDAAGRAQEFVAGDSLVVPKGFTGTWHMFGNYRELVVIEREAYDREEGAE